MSTITDTTTTTTTTLATPLTLPNGANVKNRLVKAAMSEQLAGPANQPTAELARVYRRWAHGGAGLIITGNVMIDRRSLGEPLNVVVEDDRDIEPLQHWAAAATPDRPQPPPGRRRSAHPETDAHAYADALVELLLNAIRR
jgi:hypothetical protein